MGLRELRTAFYTMAQSIPNRPATSWVNLGSAQEAPVPRLEVQVGVNVNRPPLLNGYVRQIQEMAIRVVTRKGAGDAMSEELIWSVVGHFPVGTFVEGFRVFREPEVQMPLIDGDEYVVPILISLEAHK